MSILNIPGQHILTDLSNDHLTFSQKINKVPGENIFPLIDYFDSIFNEYIYQSKTSPETEYLALGKIFEIDLPLDNLNKIEKIISEFKENVDINEIAQDVPIFFGYIKFPSKIREKIWNSFSEVKWVIPEILLMKKQKELFLVKNFLKSSDTQKDSAGLQEQLFTDFFELKKKNKQLPEIKKISSDDFVEWSIKISEALKQISKEKFKKIVISRKVEYELTGEINWAEIFERLNNEYPDCFNFLIKANTEYFFGSSPELLASFDKDKFRTEALAGSINRGTDEYEDSDLALLLSASYKNKKEHEFVIDFLKEKLYPYLHQIEIDEAPVIKRLKNIQHLQTKINGKLKQSGKYFEIIQNIFPTPAVCGIPTNQTLKELESLEGFDRGLYSGIVGNFDLKGKADFFVALRSALISGNKLSVFAGCGIVDESTPIEEFEETELKLKPITSLFRNENQSK